MTATTGTTAGATTGTTGTTGTTTGTAQVLSGTDGTTGPRPSRVPLDQVLVIVTLLSAALGLRASYDDQTFTIALVITVLVPYAIVVVTRQRIPTLIAFPLGVTVTVPLVSFMTRVAIGDMPAALTGAIPRLLTVVLPWTDDPRVAAGLLIGVALFSAASAAVASEQVRRATALVLPTLLLLGAIALSSSTTMVLVTQTIAFAIAATMFLSVGRPGRPLPHIRRAQRSVGYGPNARLVVTPLRGPVSAGTDGYKPGRNGHSRWRSGLLAVAVITVGGLIAWPLAHMVASGDERTGLHLHSDADPTALLGPMALYRLLTTEYGEGVVASVAMPEQVERIRLGILDAYNGVTWGMRSDFTPSAGVMDPMRTGTESGTITTRDLPGRFLPLPPGATMIHRTDILASDHSGVAVTADGRSVGSQSYHVDFTYPDPDTNQLWVAQRADPLVDPDAADALGSITGTEELEPYFRSVTDGALGDYERLLTLAAHVTDPENFVVGPDSAVHGVAIGPLAATITGDSESEPVTVTFEQLVTFYALVARSGGFPVRLVVGFPVPPAADAPVDLTGAAAHMWPEVLLSDIGWTPIELSDQVAAPETQQEVQQLMDSSKTDERDQMAESSGDTSTDPPAEIADESVPSTASLPWPLIMAVLAVALVLATIPGSKALKRRRRRGLPPDQAVEAAWVELAERLSDMDVHLDEAFTIEESCTHLEEMAPAVDPAVSIVGDQVRAVVYGGVEPSPDSVTEAWSAVDATIVAVRRSVPRRIRWSAPFRSPITRHRAMRHHDDIHDPSGVPLGERLERFGGSGRLQVVDESTTTTSEHVSVEITKGGTP